MSNQDSKKNMIDLNTATPIEIITEYNRLHHLELNNISKSIQELVSSNDPSLRYIISSLKDRKNDYIYMHDVEYKNVNDPKILEKIKRYIQNTYDRDF